jgi:hypothetical protein
LEDAHEGFDAVACASEVVVLAAEVDLYDGDFEVFLEAG